MKKIIIKRMKKVIILAALFLASCEKEAVSKKEENCNCDRVYKVEMSTSKIVNNGNGTGTVYQCYNIYTVNDCSKFNDKKEFVEYEGRKVPEIGSCF